MKMKIAVEYHDGTTETIIPSPLAIIGWEKLSGRKMADLASDSPSGGMGMMDMVQMVYEQARLEGRAGDVFEEWAATLADINPVEDPTDPTSGDEEH